MMDKSPMNWKFLPKKRNREKYKDQFILIDYKKANLDESL
jgi:hypothetical protein